MKKKELQDFLKRKDIVIENNVATWNISATGEIQGLYTGTFKFKCYLTPVEKLYSGRDYRELLGPNPTLVLKHEDNIAFSLSQLKYRVLSAPPFWTSAVGINGIAGDLPDENIIDVVLEAALASEFKFLAILRNRKSEVVEKAKKAAEKIRDSENEEESEDDSQS